MEEGGTFFVVSSLVFFWGGGVPKTLTHELFASRSSSQAWVESHVTEESFYAGAKARTDAYARTDPGNLPAVRWVLVEEGASVPQGAIQIGQEDDGKPLCVLLSSLLISALWKAILMWRRLVLWIKRYAARAFHDGSASIGKTWPNEKRAYVCISSVDRSDGRLTIFFVGTSNIPHKDEEVIKWSTSSTTRFFHTRRLHHLTPLLFLALALKFRRIRGPRRSSLGGQVGSTPPWPALCARGLPTCRRRPRRPGQLLVCRSSALRRRTSVSLLLTLFTVCSGLLGR